MGFLRFNHFILSHLNFQRLNHNIIYITALYVPIIYLGSKKNKKYRYFQDFLSQIFRNSNIAINCFTILLIRDLNS